MMPGNRRKLSARISLLRLSSNGVQMPCSKYAAMLPCMHCVMTAKRTNIGAKDAQRGGSVVALHWLKCQHLVRHFQRQPELAAVHDRRR